MTNHDPGNPPKGQFSLSLVIYTVTFFCVLCAMVSQRSALGVVIWSLVGMACATRLRQTYLRRSVTVMFAGCGLIAISTFHFFGATFRQDIVSIGLAFLGSMFAFSGGFATLVNAFDRGK
jgi:hypothetical protein